MSDGNIHCFLLGTITVVRLWLILITLRRLSAGYLNSSLLSDVCLVLRRIAICDSITLIGSQGRFLIQTGGNRQESSGGFRSLVALVSSQLG